MLVSSVLQASLEILDGDNTQGFTMERLAAISGVTVGSIYQYFSTKEAVIGAVYEKILQEEAQSLHAIGEQVKTLSVPEALRLIFANALRVEIRLHRLDQQFHQKYFSALQFSERYSKVNDSMVLAEKTWGRFIDYYADEIRPRDKTLAALILTRGYRGLRGAIMQSQPEVLASEEFLESLVTMALACLNYQSKPTI